MKLDRQDKEDIVIGVIIAILVNIIVFIMYSL